MQWPNDAYQIAQDILQGNNNPHIKACGIDGRLQIHSRHMWHTLTLALQTDFPSFAKHEQAVHWWHLFIAAQPVAQLTELPEKFVAWLTEQDISSDWLARARFDLACQQALHQPSARQAPMPEHFNKVTTLAALVALEYNPLNNWHKAKTYLALRREGNRIAQYPLSAADFALLTSMPKLGLMAALTQVLETTPDFPANSRLPALWQANLIGEPRTA
ncbi:hypothetical protein [Salinibius halmophilus]|uniref:hypothetical protein n=1 Tax=Salinibius halmophilus TaxID=1853216 RepID=UPI000E6606A0|nr:hypothetical protein [Salinibius halmophilus]